VLNVALALNCPNHTTAVYKWKHKPLCLRDRSCCRWQRKGSGRACEDQPEWGTDRTSCSASWTSWMMWRQTRGHSSRRRESSWRSSSETAPDPPCPISTRRPHCSRV